MCAPGSRSTGDLAPYLGENAQDGELADTVTVYNKEADIALPITLVRLRRDVDGTK